MLKISTIIVMMLFICGMTFVTIPSALSFEDYITSEATIQEEAELGEGGGEGEEEAAAASETEEAPVMGGGGSYYEEPKDEVETVEEQEIIEQEELQETDQPLYEEEQGEIR
jgi:hypothetical protein